MKILIVPELTEEILIKNRVLEMQENIQKISPHLRVASLLAWSVFYPAEENEDKSLLSIMSKGYSALSLTKGFKAYDVYIGFLLREDFPNIDTIVFESAAAKEIFEMRFREDTLPLAKEVIALDKGDSIESEIYRRTIKYN